MKSGPFHPIPDHMTAQPWLCNRGESSSRVLCMGVVTKNTVDAAIEAAYETKSPIMLIASRRQLDLSTFGPGYAGNWSTESFAQYMALRDPDKRLPLCRDHGGPWQHPYEIQAGFDESQAISSALASLKGDIDAGFNILHIDTSMMPSYCEAPIDIAIERLITLYKEVVAYTRKINASVEFEIGFEDQQTGLHDPKEFETSLVFILEELDKLKLPKPRYVVAQTGTKVVETENIGEITNQQRREKAKNNLQALVSICNKYGVGLKAHNCDYLDAESWQVLSISQIAGANVAPEYGVVETRTFLDILDKEGWCSVREQFLQIAYDSGKWKKWLSTPTTADDYKCAVIAGHYVFTTPEVFALRKLVGQRLFGGIDALDDYLKRAIKAVILQHLGWFNLL
jgi:fructose/tagatose bisphosphate aldolase